MDKRKLTQQTLKRMMDLGADKASIRLSASDTQEFNVVYRELNLLRSISTQSMGLSVIKDQKSASVNVNQLDDQTINGAIDELFQSIETADADPAYDISPHQPPSVFEKGTLKPDVDLVCDRLVEYARQCKKDYPSVQFDATMSHHKQHVLFANSNGVDLEENLGYYDFMSMFSAKDGNKMSSFNFTTFSAADLDKPVMDMNFTGELIRQITEQTSTRPIAENFTGDVIFMPFGFMEFLFEIVGNHIGNGVMMKTSRFPDHLGQKILDDKLTLRIMPCSPEMCSESQITTDGYIAEDATIIDHGILRHYLLNLFAANKTGKQRTVGSGNGFVIDPGTTPWRDMIASVKRGILCPRVSQGSPNPNGDFSAVLKNSYYIEDGRIAYPISETMMSGNVIEMFNQMIDLSAETINTGWMKAPFIKIEDLFISKK